MKKLIEVSRRDLIICDNKSCDFSVPFTEKGEAEIVKYINLPCPKCGENLLTLEDFLQDEKILSIVRWINKWFSWITIFSSQKSKNVQKIMEVHVHNGINAKIKNEN